MGNGNMWYGVWKHGNGTHLVVLVPGEAVRAEDKPVFPGGAFDERDWDTEPAFPDELVSGSSGSSLLALGGPVKPNEVRMVGVHVRQLDLDHQLQLGEEGGKEEGEREKGVAHVFLAGLLLLTELSGENSLSFVSQSWVLGHLVREEREIDSGGPGLVWHSLLLHISG